MRTPYFQVLSRAAMGLVLVSAATAQNLAEFEKRVTQFTLANGWKFLVVERRQAPVASFYTYADVGSVQEVKGITGLAHMFEHMAFKGTKTIGTKNYDEERHALDRVDQAFAALRAEQTKPGGGDKAAVAKLEEEFKAAQEGAGKFVETNELGKAIDQAGGRGLNASTSADKTDYFFSLPSNSAELWFYLESERFREPVLREFYKEAGAVREERRMRTENSPIGKLVEEFLSTAYKAHPYGEPTVGHMSDLLSFTRKEAEDFFKKYYGPSNLVSVIVGDVNPKQIQALAEKYMGRIPGSPKPDPLRTVEPPQEGERRVLVRARAQRFVVMGFHKPSLHDPDNAVYDAIGSLMSDGRSSRLWKKLVTEKQLCVQAGGFAGFPGEKYPGLFLFFGVTAPGKANDAVEKEITAELERLKNEPVSAEELEGVKNRARVGLLNLMASNTGMGREMAKWQVLTGDWRNLFRYLEKMNAVTAADVQRVAKTTFNEKNQTVGYLEPEQRASN